MHPNNYKPSSDTLKGFGQTNQFSFPTWGDVSGDDGSSQIDNIDKGGGYSDGSSWWDKHGDKVLGGIGLIDSLKCIINPRLCQQNQPPPYTPPQQQDNTLMYAILAVVVLILIVFMFKK